MKVKPTLFLKGMAMGVAEVIPGVSGGTIAFITGIYDQLLDSIKSLLGPAVWSALRRDGVGAAWREANGLFLVVLLSGMATGLIAGVFGVTALLEHYPPVIWGFFFGLIIASVIYIGRQVGKWTPIEIFTFLLGGAMAFVLTVLNPMQGSESLVAVFFSGAIAICALMLPGISGSFVLLLLGMYTLIISSVKQVLTAPDSTALAIVGVFAAGCLVGMGGFSRILSYTLARFPHPTMALLTGFMLGSLNKLWPWRNVLAYRTNSSGEQVPWREAKVLPAGYEGEPFLVATILAILAGFVLVFFLERFGSSAARDAVIETEAEAEERYKHEER